MIWTYGLYVLGAGIPVTALISLLLNPSWSTAIWLMVALAIGMACFGGARERRRRRRPAHERQRANGA